MYNKYSEGDWVKYRHKRGWVADGKVLEVRPDDKLVVGSHDKDPDTSLVDPDDVVGMVE